jgi:hypothetical protein
VNSNLKLVENTFADRDLDLVVGHSQRLVDFIGRAEHAALNEFVRQMDDSIANAEIVGNSANLTKIAEGLYSRARPASFEEVRRQLQILIGAFPNAGRHDLSIYGVALLEDVLAVQPSIGVLTDACKRLRRSNRFVPTISEVLAAFAEEANREEALLADVRDFRDRIDLARKAAADARERIERNFERMVSFCKSRIQSEQSHEWFDPEVLAEARRQLGQAVETVTAEANRKRLESLPSLRATSKADFV